VPQNSKSRNYQKYLIPRLGDTSRLQQFIFTPVEKGGNVLELRAVRDVFKVQAALAAVSVEVGGKEHALADVCLHSGGGSGAV
jgi:hypothetical protein